MVNIRKLITGDKILSRELVLLIGVGGLYTLSVALSNTFVNVYLWKQSKDFIDIALYNLIIYVFQPITFYFSGKLAKKIDRALVLRIGVIILALFYIMVLIVQENAIHYLLYLGILLGVGHGFYWLAIHLLTFEITDPENRDFFNGFSGLISSFGGMLGPLVAGFIISMMKNDIGYRIVFFISLTLFIAAVVLSFFLKKRETTGSYNVWRIFQERKNNANWRRITLSHFFQGLREGGFFFVISIYIYIVTNSELALGTYSMINSLVSFGMYYLVSRFMKKEYRKMAILIGGLILYFSVGFIVFGLTYVSFIAYGICIAVAYPLLLVPYNSMTYDVIGHSWKVAEHRIEYIVVKEWFLNAGRIVAILFFIVFVYFFSPMNSIPIFLCIFGAGHALIYVAVRKIEYHVNPDQTEVLECAKGEIESTE